MCVEEDDTPQFTMSIAIDQSKKPESSTANNGRRYQWESSDVYSTRAAVASKYMQEGLTSKHAWYKAFQEHPRVYLDDAPEASAPSADDCDAGKTFFKPRV